MEKIKRYLIDSDILIDHLRGNSCASDFLFDLRKEGILMISVINVVEIYSGTEIKNKTKREIINRFISEFEIISLGENLAKEAGEIRMMYQMPFADAIIAASAIESKSFLATRNLKHFSKVKNLKIISPK